MMDDRVLAAYSGVQVLRSEGSVRSYRATGSDGTDLLVKFVDTDAESARAATMSLQSVESVKHPNLATIREQGLTDTGFYFVREWVDGAHLGTGVRISPSAIASAVGKGLAGMAAIHGLGLVCGDVKPTNFVVAPDGSTKLVDFLVPPGRVGQGTEPATTAYYTSPEEIAGASPSPASDIYRAGLVLYEALTARHPFDGADAAAVIAGHERTVPASPSTINPQSPKALDAVVAKSLSKDPAARYASADAMRRAIDEATTSKKFPVWAWVAVAVVAVAVLIGLFSTQTEQGRLWMLGLRSMVTVPNVVGQTQAQAQSVLEGSGLRVGQVTQEATLAVPPGAVARQTPVGGTSAKKDSAVDLAVAVLPSAKVPDVIGETESDAVTLLAEEGLRAGSIEYVYDSKAKAGDVTAQQPSASTEVSIGAAVALTVSKGTQQGQVPNVIGLSQDDANAVITAAGFKVTTVKATSSSVPAGDVMAQSPAAGVVTAAGSTVTITVSTGEPATPTTPTPPETPSTPATTPATPSQPAKPSEPAQPGTKPSQPIANTVEVPDVVGMSVREAVKALRGAKLKVSFAFAPSETAILKVTKQDPASGATVDPGSTVVITIGLPSISLPEGKPTQPTPVPAPQPAEQPAQQPAQQPAESPTVVPEPSVPTSAP